MANLRCATLAKQKLDFSRSLMIWWHTTGKRRVIVEVMIKSVKKGASPLRRGQHFQVAVLFIWKNKRMNKCFPLGSFFIRFNVFRDLNAHSRFRMLNGPFDGFKSEPP